METKAGTGSWPATVNETFARDVLEGLTQFPKKLSSKYFYDENGDRLFQDIMQMPEYYLTDAELEIFERHKQAIFEKVNEAPFDIIELGAGDGFKTKVLLGHFLEQGADLQYCAIDISNNVLQQLEKDLKDTWPHLSYQSLEGDYFEVLEAVNKKNGRKKVILFLGANIGNLQLASARRFIERIRENMHCGDLLFIGFDLKKDPQIILDAYNDPAGITAAFNLNLLRRINRELGGHFDLDAFKHWESYNPVTGETKSFLVSKKVQTVRIDALDHDFDFDAWEAIDVELSLKYSLPEVESLARDTGFEVAAHFFDNRRYFVDSLWRKREKGIGESWK